MSEYIERGALLANQRWDGLTLEHDKARAKEIILCQPTADVVEVKHGRWKREYDSILNRFYWSCSECKEWAYSEGNYCPNCGADMRGERRKFLRIGRCNHCGYTKQKMSKYQQGVGWSYCPTCKGLCVKWETVDGGADNG